MTFRCPRASCWAASCPCILGDWIFSRCFLHQARRSAGFAFGNALDISDEFKMTERHLDAQSPDCTCTASPCSIFPQHLLVSTPRVTCCLGLSSPPRGLHLLLA